MASRKEEKERLRQAREEAEARDRAQQRKRLVLGYVVAGLITVAVVVGIVAVIAGGGDGGGTGEVEGERVDVEFGTVPDGLPVDDREAVDAPSGGDVNVVGGEVSAVRELAEAANCEVMFDQQDEGNTHIPLEQGAPNYRANPPTSGSHFQVPLADGAFAEMPSPLYFVHALEHGRIEIQYHPRLPEDQQRQLLGLYDQSSPGMIVFPNPDMPHLLAATAWRNTLACDSFEGAATLDAIRGFREAFRGRGPEPVALQ